jgi:hypothetical protein
MVKLKPAEVLALKKTRQEARKALPPKGWKKAREILSLFKITCEPTADRSGFPDS